MVAEVLLDKDVFVAYGQIYLESATSRMDGEMDWHPLPVPAGDYRVRYSACGMDEGYEADEDDRYLLQLWPAPPAPDRTIRVTSAGAAYWHNWAQGLPSVAS